MNISTLLPSLPRQLAVAIIGAALALTGCTFEPGNPWGYLDARLTADPVDNSGPVEVTDQSVDFGQLELRAPGGGTGGVDDFDPSDPPPGFSLCHQDHCHHEDGSIYTYDEIEAGMGVDPDEPVNLQRRDLDTGHLALTAPVEVEQQFAIGEQTSVNEVAVTVNELALEATADDGDKSVTLEISLAMNTRPLSTGIHYEFGPDHPEYQTLELALRWPDDLFDDIPELAAAVDDADDGDTIAIHGTSNPDIRETLVNRIGDDAQFEWIEDG